MSSAYISAADLISLTDTAPRVVQGAPNPLTDDDMHRALADALTKMRQLGYYSTGSMTTVTPRGPYMQHEVMFYFYVMPELGTYIPLSAHLPIH